ncbi:MAG: hypothetical protein H0W67_02410 [Gemmatimonadales bacterium]|nr:hypothetical protein [Gemmatimonadales bacterium]
MTLVGTAAAQVGHRPDASPFRDVRKGHTVTAMGGWFGGGGGRFKIGPHAGTIFGGRYDIRSARTIGLGLGIFHATLDRFIIDPFVEVANRLSGPVSQGVTFAEIDIQLNLTGAKTWHRLAPYVNIGGGLASAGTTAADTSRYKFGRKFYFVPAIGTRLFITDRLHLRAEARTAFWKLKYPDSFRQEPVLEPGTESAPNAVIPDGRTSEWSANPWLQVGLGYGFSP